jgi:type VI secretion system secreted protein VgrG
VEDRAAIYEFVLRPFVWRATKNRDKRIFRGRTVIEVLGEVFSKDHGTIDWRIAGPSGAKGYYPQRDMIRHQSESDWDFALRLMERQRLWSRVGAAALPHQARR